MRLFSLLGLLVCHAACASTPVAPLVAPPVVAPSSALASETPLSEAPASAEPPAVARAAVHPAVPRLLELFGRAAEGGVATNGHLSEEECRELTGFRSGAFDRCSLQLHANATAAEVGFTYDCGGDSCSAETYVWYGDEPNPYHLEGNTYPVEVSPDHRYLLLTQFDYGDPPMMPTGGQTVRIDRATGKKEPFLDCFSAVLSPGGRYYACRNLAADVLRVPVTGGKPEPVVRAQLPPDEHIKLGGPFDDYPAPVTFNGATELEYELYLLESERVLKRKSAWSE